MPLPAGNEPQGSLSPNTPPLARPASGWSAGDESGAGRPAFQRIGWQRPTAGERRLWIVGGVLILAGVLLIGALMVLALR